MNLQSFVRGLAAAVILTAMTAAPRAQGIFYDENTGRTVTRDGSDAFVLDVPMPLAPPLLPPRGASKHRKTLIIAPRKLRRVGPEPHTYRPWIR